MVNIVNVGYDSTNYYVIAAERGQLLVDVGWPGTLPKLRHMLTRARQESGRSPAYFRPQLALARDFPFALMQAYAPLDARRGGRYSSPNPL